VAFWCYAAALFTMTHWPKLRVPGPTGTDLVAHMVAFGAWTVLLGLAALLGRRFSLRAAALGLVVGVLYAAFDEGLQAIPVVGRVCSWSDYGANVLGVVVGSAVVGVMGVVGRAHGRRDSAAR
jgi:VanZ family protein